MDKKLLIIIALILLLIGGGTAFLLLREDDKPEEQAPNNAVTTPTDNPHPHEAAAEEMPAEPQSPGKYVEYDEAAVAATAGTKLIFFHAPWCPQCRALEADILDKGVPAGVTIFKVDYDTNQDLRQKYGVTLQTTVVKVDDNGNKIDSYVAYDEPTLQAVQENLLQ